MFAGAVVPKFCLLGLVLLMAAPSWPQANTAPAQPVSPQAGTNQTATNPSTTNQSAASADNNNNDTDNSVRDDRMLTPAPVSGQPFPTEPVSEERSNYLRYGLSFTSAYTDNALGAVNGHRISDVSYSLAPTVAVGETTSHAHLLVSYAPGFTFYQRTSALNEADQNALIGLEWRLSPHVTVTARDSFQKSSSVFNQPDLGSAGSVSGGTEGGNFSVIAPLADRLSNSGNAGISYQFGPNSMVGASGTFSNLHYPNPTQVSGLYDTSSQGGSAFYAWRAGKMHYFGATYQYQRLMSYPSAGLSETQTQAAILFYSLNPTPRFAISVFGGPQHSDTIQPPSQSQPSPELKAWNPEGGASAGWQGRVSTFAVAYNHSIASGGGLIGAVHMDSATAFVRQQVNRSFSASVSAGYVQNNVVGSVLPGTYSGHSFSGTASVQQQVGQHLGVQLGYTRLHQDYSNVAVIALTPDTNREFVSLAYQFARPLGR
jgi:hypothetical protein